jgi:hypothetical protein
MDDQAKEKIAADGFVLQRTNLPVANGSFLTK